MSNIALPSESDQLGLWDPPTTKQAARNSRPVLRRRDLEGATEVRTEYGTFDVVRVNSDNTITIRDQANPKAVPHVVPYGHVEGIVR